MKQLLQRAGLGLAKWAGYNAAFPNKTMAQPTRIGTNPNSQYSQYQRIQLSLNGQNCIKNTPFGINYLAKRVMYCSAQINYSPDTGDEGLDTELSEALKEEWRNMGIECSMQEAFSRVADNFMPVSGDALLVWYRDEERLRLIEVTADRIGEQWTFMPSMDANGRTYIAGTFWEGCNRVGFRVYDRSGDSVYVNPRFVEAANCIYFADDTTGGVRGISAFAGALEDVNSRYEILKATKDTMLQQSKTAAIASNNSGSPSEYDVQTIQHNDGSIEYVESFADGAIVRYQFNGDSYQVLKAEQPSEAFVKGMKYVDAQAALATKFPYEFLFTASDSGGAPARLAIEIASREIQRIRNNVHRPRLDKISFVTIGDIVDRKKIRLPMRRKVNVYRGDWHFGTLPTADAFRDDAADTDAVRSGTKTRNMVTVANYGLPFEKVLRETAKETYLIHREVQDINRRLISDGYEATATIADIALNTDNPAQTTPEEKNTLPSPQG